jgi:DNA-binding NarL/FixJ family response regulator
VRATAASSHHGSKSNAVLSVALVSGDNRAILRIREVLAANAILVADQGVHVAELGDLIGVSAIVIPANKPATECRARIREAVGCFPDIPAVVTGTLSSNGIHKILAAGALGYVHEPELKATLAATIRAVSAGQVVVPRQLSRTAARPALSHREKQTLALLAKGFTNREIAARLFLAESTVKTHLTSVFGKLGVHSRSEAAEIVLDPDQKIRLGIQGLTPSTATETSSGGQQAWK